MPITKDQLLKIMPYAGPRAEVYLAHLNRAMIEFEINTPARQAAFLAQIAHESAQLACVEENLNYSAAGLMRTWPKRFPTLAIANQYAKNPEKLANYVYANRMGNGAPETGDGWRYRGAGLKQLTGKENHQRCASYFGIAVELMGGWLRTPEGACRSAAWFWKRADCNRLADLQDFDAISDVINIGRDTKAEGDAIGYKERFSFYSAAKGVLA